MTLTSTPRLTVQLIRDASDLMLLLWPPVTAGSQRRLEYRGLKMDDKSPGAPGSRYLQPLASQLLPTLVMAPSSPWAEAAAATLDELHNVSALAEPRSIGEARQVSHAYVYVIRESCDMSP